MAAAMVIEECQNSGQPAQCWHGRTAVGIAQPNADSCGIPGLLTDDASISPAIMRISEGCRETLKNAGMESFDAIMNSRTGHCLRILPDRENWYLQDREVRRYAAPGSFRPRAEELDGAQEKTVIPGMYLKKHRIRNWATRMAAAFGRISPPSAGRVEAENALALQSLGIEVMPLMAYGEKLRADGRLESFLLTEELQGYLELQEFIERRFASCDRLPLRRLIVQVADIARRFHTAGFNHRDFYCCHFLVKEISPGRFDVRLIDLQRVQRRQWFRWRWIVKDLAQLASMSPDGQIGCREKVLFLRTYLGVQKLRPRDKRLVRDVLWKMSLIRGRTRRKS